MDNNHKSTYHGPVQFVDFVENVNSSKYRILKLNEEAVTQVFQAAGERPVAIITIAGPSRKGKSFFLDFVIRYFEALERDESDWMGWDDKNRPLTGFSWRTSTERETTGIVAWSRPFIIKSKGQEIAVILLDSQGTYDEYTTEREMAAIVGLSLLSSSCLVFNFFSGIQEDVFNSLDTYISYGQLALQEEDDAMDVDENSSKIQPFQKLLFLIRDWMMPTVHPFGTEGGKAYLKKKLEVKEGLTQTGVKVRQTLRHCFEELDCCLLPGIGQKAMEPGFNGSLAQLDLKFCRKLEELLNELLNPDELPLKSVFGNGVLAVDMVSYFKQYVEVFNGDDIPAPLTLMEATAKIAMDNLLQKLFRKYCQTMKKKQRGRHFLSDSAMATSHKSALKESLNEFKAERKLGDKTTIEKLEAGLKFKIEEGFVSINAENKNKKTKLIESAMTECLQSFRETMKDNFEDEEIFMEERKLKSLSSSLKTDMTTEFEEKLQDCDEDEMEKVSKAWNNKLDEEEGRIILDNENRKLNAEKKMALEVNQICELYRDKLTDQLADQPFQSGEELTEYHIETKPEFKKMWEQVKRTYPKEFMKPYPNQLEGKLEKEFQDLKKSQENKLHKIYSDGENCLKEILAECEITFRSNLESDDSFLEQINSQDQNEIMEQAENLFDTRIRNSIPPTSKIGQELRRRLKEDFDTMSQAVVNEVILSKKECEESYKKALVDSLDIYFENFDAFIRGAAFHNEEDLEEKHKEFQTKSIEVYEALPKIGVHPNPDQFLDHLSKKMDQQFKTMLDQNSERKNLVLTTAQNLVHRSHQDYQSEMMNQLELVEDKAHFTDLHKTEKEKAINSFKDQCEIKTPEIVAPFLEELETEIESSFEELLEVLDLKLKDKASGTKFALLDARKFYREEMTKHYNNTEFMRPKDLEALHQKVSQLAIDKCSEKTALSQNQVGDLKKALEETYISYKEENDMNVPVDPAIGIDLGTTYSCAAVYLKGSVKVIPNAQGKNTTPSYVSYLENGNFESVGIPAKEKAYDNAENTIYDAKRIIGRKFDDPNLQNDMKFWPFKVVDDKQVPKVEINGKKLHPEQISAEVLREMRLRAEKYLNCPVENVVITVPAYFTDGQRQATIDAGICAGFKKVLNILTEPVAAAVAYKLQHNDDHKRHVLTFDLGGGTFDVAVLKMSKGNIETLAVDGDTHLGGEDFDQNVMTYCSLEFQKEHGINLMDGKDSTSDNVRQDVRRRLKRLQLECERRKIDLASCRSVDICVAGIHNEAGVSTDLKVNLTREMFEKLNQDLFEKTIEIVERCLKDASIDKSKIEDIVLVGGSTQIPKIQQLLEEFFDGKALNLTINPDTAVAYGAAVQAAMMNGQIAQQHQDFNRIQDVSPMSMGIEVYGGGFSIIIPKNTKIPVKFMEQYRTAHNNQTSVQITVYQGEDVDVAKNNNWLGEFYLNNIPPGDAGRETINVTMEINLQGVLHVMAVCTSTGDKDSITVTEHKRRMGKEQIKRILDEARPGSP